MKTCQLFWVEILQTANVYFQVFNMVVDNRKPESVLVLERPKAEYLFSKVERVPKNALKIITPDLYEYQPPTTGYY